MQSYPQKAVEILDRAIRNHEWRQRRCINLIPSEMTPSPLVRLLQVTDPVGRYAEHNFLSSVNREVYYYQGTDFIAWVEEQLIQEMAKYLRCRQVEPRLISGQTANMAVFSALVAYRNRHDTGREVERIRLVLNHHLGLGGHLSAQPMGPMRDYVAKDPATGKFAVIHFPVCKDNPYRVDVPAVADLVADKKPELVIFGKSMFIEREPVAEVRKLFADRAERPLFMFDAAHVLGILGPYFQDPIAEGADLVTGSTHKTFFGTQRGIIGASLAEDSPWNELWQTVRRRAFPGFLSNHHLGTMLGLLLAAVEMNAFRDDYQRQVVANAKALAKALHDAGVAVEGDPALGYTETHQVLVHVGQGKGEEVAARLEKNHIIVNYQALPHDANFTVSSGLRLGVAEMTRFGMKERDFGELAELMADVILRNRDAAEAVAQLRGRFLEMQYCFQGEEVWELKEKLLATFA